VEFTGCGSPCGTGSSERFTGNVWYTTPWSPAADLLLLLLVVGLGVLAEVPVVLLLALQLLPQLLTKLLLLLSILLLGGCGGS
jgi:hypothetical protein